jgi:hypothetical protein
MTVRSEMKAKGQWRGGIQGICGARPRLTTVTNGAARMLGRKRGQSRTKAETGKADLFELISFLNTCINNVTLYSFFYTLPPPEPYLRNMILHAVAECRGLNSCLLF